MTATKKFSRAALTLSLSCGAVLFSGCAAVQKVASSAPVATPPTIVQAGGPTVVRCWDNPLHCYLRTSQGDEQTTNGDYQASWEVGYNVLNAFSVDEDSTALAATDLAAPPATQTFYGVRDSSPPVAGRAKLVLTLFPKRSPQSKAHGETSTFHLKEHSSNPQYHGTAQEFASSDLQLTFVNTNYCQIIDLAVPASVAKGDNISVSWNVQNCKSISLFRSIVPSGTSVSINPAHPVAASPELQTTTPQTADNFSASRSFSTTMAATETYRLVATDAVGTTQTLSRTVSVNAPGGSSGNSGGSNNNSTCASQHSVNLCMSCPGLYGGAAIESETQALACSDDDAKTAVGQTNPGCAVSVGGFQTFKSCVSCQNNEKTTEESQACSQDGANAKAAQRHSSDCQVATGACAN